MTLQSTTITRHSPTIRKHILQRERPSVPRIKGDLVSTTTHYLQNLIH